MFWRNIGRLKIAVRDLWIHSTARKNTVKRNLERRVPTKSSGTQRLFSWANLVLRPAWSRSNSDWCFKRDARWVPLVVLFVAQSPQKEMNNKIQVWAPKFLPALRQFLSGYFMIEIPYSDVIEGISIIMWPGKNRRSELGGIRESEFEFSFFFSWLFAGHFAGLPAEDEPNHDNCVVIIQQVAAIMS